MLLRRAVDLRAALKVGFRLSLADVRADEFAAMLILENEQTNHIGETEQAPLLFT